MSAAAEQFDPSQFAPTARSEKEFIRQHVPRDDDEGVTAYFYKRDEHQPFASQEEGRDVFRQIDCICIRVYGNDKSEFHGPVLEEHKKRFPYAWQQYQAGKEQAVKGTPLEELGIPGSLVNTFYAKNIFTVEDLSRVTDSNLQSLPSGCRELRHRARQHIESRGRKTEQDERIDALMKQNAELSTQLTRALAAIEAQADKPKKGKD